MTSYICIATLNIQQLGNDLDVTTEKLKTDEDSGFENDDQDQEESNDDIHPEIPIANGTSIKRDLVLSTTSKGFVDDQNDNSETIGNGLNQHLGGYIQVPVIYILEFSTLSCNRTRISCHE